jgi:hypothetical protein
MIIMKNLVALAAIFIAVPALYVGVTVPAFLATSYLMIGMFCCGISAWATWNLGTQNKLWLAAVSALWWLMMVVGNGAV